MQLGINIGMLLLAGLLFCVCTCLMVSVNTMSVEEHQEQTEAEERCYGSTQQEGVAAFTVDYLQEAIHTLSFKSKVSAVSLGKKD